MTLLTTELRDSFAASTKAVNEARLLPPLIYTSQEFYEFERRSIFRHEWLCVGRVDQVPEPGDFRCITIAGEPLIMLRDSDGSVGVISAVCQHRGMVLAEGSGNTRRFTCPYHHWSYGLDGSLLGAPAMERAVGFDKGDHGLRGSAQNCGRASCLQSRPGRQTTGAVAHQDRRHAGELRPSRDGHT